ncbi:Brix-domain-containing protein [Aulographum hederae CBS 113979]|uniref:Ribosome production factor 2 homolog n=1 Tax=Aulographum hederae CBS 113979 TaxID=1176131 RepID=A0A6G1GYS4_9PEZI|nr:Brix-domain-containing protein [Aulographum hederae CBS 113979]
MLRQIVPKNARSKRALEKKEPQLNENPKTTLFLRGATCPLPLQRAYNDIHALKQPLCKKFTKKNEIHPFEDPSSLEFFSEKNDTSLIVFAYHTKKRQNCLTLARMFNHKVLDMIELHIDGDSFRSLHQFKNSKPQVGMKPMMAFSGSLFESPTPNAYTLAKSLLLDLFRGQEISDVEVTGLQYIIQVSAEEESDVQPKPRIHLRVYRIITKSSGQKLPRVELDEIGPRIDFSVGRIREADESVMKEALKRPRQLEPKTKKNIDMDLMGDKVGRIHVGKQDIDNMQTRKMKGLKRSRGEEDEDGMTDGEDVEMDGLADAKKPRK